MMHEADMIRIFHELDELTAKEKAKPSRLAVHLGALIFGLAISYPLWLLLLHDWLKGWVK